MREYKIDEEKIVGQTGFRLVTPFLALFIVAMFCFAANSSRGPVAYAVAVFVSVPALLAIFGLYDGKRFWWARRGVGFYVFLGTLSYAISQFRMGTASTAIRWETSAEYLVVALSALRYALTGKVWVDVILMWFSSLIAPLARIDIGGPGNTRKKKHDSKWYDTNG